MTDTDKPDLPDLQQGVNSTELQMDQPLRGTVGEHEVLLVRTERAVFAVGADCPHKGAPMEDGLVVGQTIRCPFHHACFDMAVGSPSAPAMDPLPCWGVEESEGKIRVLASDTASDVDRDSKQSERPLTDRLEDAGMVIVGAGAAGQAAAETLRRVGYTGSIHLISASDHLPIDRTNLSKAFLTGGQNAADIQLRGEAYYEAQDITLLMNTSVVGINVETESLTLSNNVKLPYQKLLLAMGSTPRTLPIEGASARHVHTLRYLADAEHLVDAFKSTVEHVVIVGSGFIALEAAAALRERNMEVRIVTADNLPMERLVGETMADYIRSKHESQGVKFTFNDKLEQIDTRSVKTEKGHCFPADLVLVAVGVEPETELVKDEEIVAVDDGILVNEQLLTSRDHIFAAGDLARWPYYGGGDKQSVRIEHWAVAQRQGQAVAHNMLGDDKPYRTVPFFWSKQFDINIRYSGHTQDWDTHDIDGSMEEECFSIRYSSGGVAVAMLSVNQDRQNLEFEAALENRIAEKAV